MKTLRAFTYVFLFVCCGSGSLWAESAAAMATPAAGTPQNGSATPASMVANAGTTPQSASVGALFGMPLQVTVKDSGGRAVNGTAVTFSAPMAGSGGAFAGAGSTAAAITDVNGIATAPAFTANTAAGSYVVTATLASGPGVSFLVSNTAGTPAKVIAVDGMLQGADTGTQFGIQFKANVIDSSGKPISGVVVVFTAPSSGASGKFPDGTQSAIDITDDKDVATTPPFTANDTAGHYTVMAAAGAAIPTTFALDQGAKFDVGKLIAQFPRF